MSMLRPIIALALLIPCLWAQAPSKLPNLDRRTPVVLAVENVGPAVVNIRAQSRVRRQHLYFGLFLQEGEDSLADSSMGSGVLVHPDGYVVTNEHVTHGAERLLVKFKDGQELPATVVNSNMDSDLAVLKIQANGPFPTAELGSSDQLLVGETVIALGNPFGLSSSATMGILSATGRSVRFQGRNVFEDFLQTSALINPGNSGGPLLDINGRVIGINVAIDSRGQGIGFAIPIDRVKNVITDLVDPEASKGLWTGILPGFSNGALVAAHVDLESPAQVGGIERGDLIIAVDGKPVRSPFEFQVALLRFDPATEVKLDLLRNGTKLERRMKLGEVPLSEVAKGTNTLRVLGMECADISTAISARLKLPSNVVGPVVLSVEPGTQANSVGLRPRDVIIQINSINVASLANMQMALRVARRSGGARISVWREGEGRMEGMIAF